MQSILKLVNSLIGMVGMAMILYALWMIRVWQRHMADLPFGGGSDFPVSWYEFYFSWVFVFLVGFEILHFGFVWLLRKCGKGKDILVVPG